MSNPKIPLSRTLFIGWEFLLVEDDDDSREIAVRTLTHCGAAVHTAFNGELALQKLETILPRVILSDLSMPIMSGWQLREHLKHDPRFQLIPVIALTAHALSADRERALAAGFDGYLTKPLTAGGLISDLVALLKSFPQFSDLF